jgi:transposase
MDKVWAGIDAGKEVHWAHVLDAAGQQILSRRVENDEADLLRLVDEVLTLSEEAVWAVDQPGGSAALLLALLWERDQRVLYLPGLAVDRARDAYPGESKTDARDAYVIADQARMRPNLAQLVPGEDDLAELQLLLARRRDLVADRTRSINRLRDVLLSLFPALERALDLNGKGALILVRHYQTPGAIRRVGFSRLAAFLKNRGVKGAEDIARKALTAAKAQSVALPAEDVAATICAELAAETLALKEGIDTLDGELGRRFFARPEARILASLPGMGPILGSEFLVSVGDLLAFESADQLAAYAGLVPAARDSGMRVGHNR